MEVIPIVQPVINWDAYVTGAKELLGRSPTRSLDTAGIRAGSHVSYVQSLGEFQHEGTAPVPFLKGRESDRAFEHLFAGFLIACDNQTMTEFARLARVPMIESDNVVIATATVAAWRTAVIECSHPKCSKGLRQVANKIQHVFSIWGFGCLWQGMLKHTSDGTVALLPPSR